MTTKSPEALTKHTLHLRKGDFDFLKDRFPRLGASLVVRRIVSKFVDRIDQPVSDEQIRDLINSEESTNDND